MMQQSNGRMVWWFFAAVYVISGALYSPVLISGEGTASPINIVLLVAVTFVPSLMGVLFIYLTQDRDGRRDFWRRTLRWPRGYTAVAVGALLLLPALEVAVMLLPGLWGEPLPSLAYAGQMLRDGRLLLQFLVVEFFLGAVSEELGWRGYALDALQARWHPLTASLVLGAIWALWHTPAFLIPGLSQHEWGGILSWPYVSFVLMVLAGSVIQTWAYNATGRSILVGGILVHFAKNAATILLAGIFDDFAVTAGYWIVSPLVYGAAAAVIAGGWFVRGRGMRLRLADRSPLR